MTDFEKYTVVIAVLTLIVTIMGGVWKYRVEQEKLKAQYERSLTTKLQGLEDSFKEGIDQTRKQLYASMKKDTLADKERAEQLTTLINEYQRGIDSVVKDFTNYKLDVTNKLLQVSHEAEKLSQEMRIKHEHSGDKIDEVVELTKQTQLHVTAMQKEFATVMRDAVSELQRNNQTFIMTVCKHLGTARPDNQEVI